MCFCCRGNACVGGRGVVVYDACVRKCIVREESACSDSQTTAEEPPERERERERE